jgi:hypothetical protein
VFTPATFLSQLFLRKNCQLAASDLQNRLHLQVFCPSPTCARKLAGVSGALQLFSRDMGALQDIYMPSGDLSCEAANVGRTFSAMAQICTYLRNRMSEQKLCTCVIEEPQKLSHLSRAWRLCTYGINKNCDSYLIYLNIVLAVLDASYEHYC